MRRLENEALKEQLGVEIVLGELDNPIQVSIGQFYGIEINDFAVTVAKTALWIAEAQMMAETESIVHMNLDFLPLKSYANIVEGNALALDWGEVVPRDKVDYIMGNPPFVGASMMNAKQKAEAVAVFGKGKRVTSIDYVGAWYHKAAAFLAFPSRGRLAEPHSSLPTPSRRESKLPRFGKSCLKSTKSILTLLGAPSAGTANRRERRRCIA